MLGGAASATANTIQSDSIKMDNLKFNSIEFNNYFMVHLRKQNMEFRPQIVIPLVIEFLFSIGVIIVVNVFSMPFSAFMTSLACFLIQIPLLKSRSLTKINIEVKIVAILADITVIVASLISVGVTMIAISLVWILVLGCRVASIYVVKDEIEEDSETNEKKPSVPIIIICVLAYVVLPIAGFVTMDQLSRRTWTFQDPSGLQTGWKVVQRTVNLTQMFAKDRTMDSVFVSFWIQIIGLIIVSLVFQLSRYVSRRKTTQIQLIWFLVASTAFSVNHIDSIKGVVLCSGVENCDDSKFQYFSVDLFSPFVGEQNNLEKGKVVDIGFCGSSWCESFQTVPQTERNTPKHYLMSSNNIIGAYTVVNKPCYLGNGKNYTEMAFRKNDLSGSSQGCLDLPWEPLGLHSRLTRDAILLTMPSLTLTTSVLTIIFSMIESFFLAMVIYKNFQQAPSTIVYSQM